MIFLIFLYCVINSVAPGWSWHNFVDKMTFLVENALILTIIEHKFLLKGPISSIIFYCCWICNMFLARLISQWVDHCKILATLHVLLRQNFFSNQWIRGPLQYENGVHSSGFRAVWEFGKRPGNTKKCFLALEKWRNLINLPKTQEKSVNFIPGHGIFASVAYLPHSVNSS